MLQRGAEYIARFFVAQGKLGFGTHFQPTPLAKNNPLVLSMECLLVCFSIYVIFFGVLLRLCFFNVPQCAYLGHHHGRWPSGFDAIGQLKSEGRYHQCGGVRERLPNTRAGTMTILVHRAPASTWEESHG